MFPNTERFDRFVRWFFNASPDVDAELSRSPTQRDSDQQRATAALRARAEQRLTS